MTTTEHEAVAPGLVLAHEAGREILPDACGAKGCYPDRRCASCRLADGDACESCGGDGEVLGGMFREVVLCASCKAAEEGGA